MDRGRGPSPAGANSARRAIHHPAAVAINRFWRLRCWNLRGHVRTRRGLEEAAHCSPTAAPHATRYRRRYRSRTTLQLRDLRCETPARTAASRWEASGEPPSRRPTPSRSPPARPALCPSSRSRWRDPLREQVVGCSAHARQCPLEGLSLACGRRDHRWCYSSTRRGAPAPQNMALRGSSSAPGRRDRIGQIPGRIGVSLSHRRTVQARG